MKKKVFPAMGWLLTFISGAAHAGLTDSLSGVWEGYGWQNNGTEWSIKITAENGNYSIEYPSLSCGGKLLLLSENSGSATFREELEYGLSSCINLGKVELYRMEANLLKYIWYYPNDSVGAYGDVSCDSCQVESVCTEGEIATVTISENLDIHIPFANYHTLLLGDTPLWADLKFSPNPEGRILWELSDYGLLED
jgi:hypothetical protein